MVWLTLQDFLVVRNRSILIIRKLLECLTKAKMSVNRFGIDLDCVFEILSCTLSFTKISK